MNFDFKNRIVEFLKVKEIGQTAFEDKVGLSRGAISKIREGMNGDSLKKIIAHYPDINMAWLLTGEGEMLKNKENIASEPKPYFKTRQELKNGGKKKQIPFYDAPAAAGVTETEMTAIHAPAGTIDIGDLLHDSEAAIRIYGNSMVPNYPPGCVVGLAKISNTFIEPGEVYVIETADRRLLKRLFYKDDNTDGPYITCYSDNIMKFDGGARHGKLAYPPFDLPKKEIKNLFVVTGVIKRNSNSIIINR